MDVGYYDCLKFPVGEDERSGRVVTLEGAVVRGDVCAASVVAFVAELGPFGKSFVVVLNITIENSCFYGC